MQVHQLIHTLSYGDAISGECLAIQRCFQELGVESRIYSINTHPFYAGKTESYQAFPTDYNQKVILHYSLGSVLNDLYRKLDKAQKSIIFHNITPAKYFESINPRVAADIQNGWKELPELCALSNLVVSDSGFNARELEAYSVKSKILPLPFDPNRWQEPENSGFKRLIETEPGIHLLHVGRLAPNKCIEDIIKTFYYLRHKFSQQNCRLWLVGTDVDTELYSYGLKRLAQELSVYDYINFTGPLQDSEIKALYQNCSAYLCMSEHEGFCVPLIEAMHFGLPVIAYAQGAVPETVADGGILFSDKRYPQIAAMINKISTDSKLRSALRDAGQSRVSNLSYEIFKEKVSSYYLNNWQ